MQVGVKSNSNVEGGVGQMGVVRTELVTLRQQERRLGHGDGRRTGRGTGEHIHATPVRPSQDQLS